MYVYQSCPTFITPHYTLLRTREADAPGLLRVYTDHQALAYIRAGGGTEDVCQVDGMQRCIARWQRAYQQQEAVRWTIFEGATPVGSVELRHASGDAAARLRIDLRRDREFADVHEELLRTMLPALFELFACRRIWTQVGRFMQQRQEALRAHGFRPAEENGLAWVLSA